MFVVKRVIARAEVLLATEKVLFYWVRTFLRRGGPHWLDSFVLDLRWKTPVLMQRESPECRLSADSSMPHGASGRQVTNADVLRCNA